jgi:polyribonucleotide nucleotidyltransferase
MDNVQTFEKEIAGKRLRLEIGKLAGSANAAVRAEIGETVVLATAVMGAIREGSDYFPLMVDFDEKLYAAGRIKGSRWIKREGRPSDEAILTARLIDRTIRPLFDKRMRNEVQVIVTVLSFDNENDPDVLGIIAASTALRISDIPWSGPVAAVRVALGPDGNPLINPTYAEREESALDFVVSGPSGLVNMLEGGANEVSDENVAQAIIETDSARAEIIAFQEEVAASIGKNKAEVPFLEPDNELLGAFKSAVENRLESTLFVQDAYERMRKSDELKKEIVATLKESFPNASNLAGQVDEFFEKESAALVQEKILSEGRRVDGRALDAIRPLSMEVGVLPRTHGSALFNRGHTQALSILTLGAPGLEQSLETMELVGTKRFIHHYNFPPYSTGEVGRLFTGRREIGHGALAERALDPVIPPKESFPYVVRIVTEILSSNGSTSMASVCGSTLALLDAGVPVTSPVAGISVGLVLEDENTPDRKYALLTDIQGVEDFYGNMDFKVAGTRKGVTAVQVDVKVRGLTHTIIRETFARARQARETILDEIAKTLSEPRPELSPYAPRVLTLKINPDKIRNVIGPGGKVINEITEETGVTIDIEDDGMIFITSTNLEAAERAREWVNNITREVLPGEVFTGKVARLLNFGAFVEILPGQQGLVHVSELSDSYVQKVDDVVKVGDMVTVRV